MLVLLLDTLGLQKVDLAIGERLACSDVNVILVGMAITSIDSFPRQRGSNLSRWRITDQPTQLATR
jgi:hypothetical protein